MSLLQKDFEKIENLLNRAFVLLRHLQIILSEVLRYAPVSGRYVSDWDAGHVNTVLHSAHAYLKALADIFKDVIQIHESTKQHIGEFEAKIKSLIGNGSVRKPYHDLETLETYFREKCLRDVKTEEEKLHKIRINLYEEFIRFHLSMGTSLLSSLADRGRYIFKQEPTTNDRMYTLQNEWIDHSKKFAGVIEAIYRLLKRDEAIEGYVQKELERTYGILSEGDTSKLYPVTESVSENTARMIRELEKAYDQM